MIARTRESSGIARLAERPADDRRVGARRDLELDDLHLAVGEHVRLSRGGHADRAGDRVRGLELGRDREVDVEASLAPEVDVLDVRRPDHGRRPRRLDARERAGDEVHLVARGAGDEEIRVGGARLAGSSCGWRRSPSIVRTSKRYASGLEALARRCRSPSGRARRGAPRRWSSRPVLHRRRRSSRRGAAYPSPARTPRGSRTVRLLSAAWVASSWRVAARRSPRSLARSALAAGAATPRLAVVARGLSSPVYVTQAPGAAEPALRRRAGRTDPHRRARARDAGRSSTSARWSSAGGEQGLLGLRLLAAVRAESHVLRQVHAHARATGTWSSGTAQPARARVPGERAGDPERPAALLEPRRRSHRVRAGREAVGRDRRRRLGRRSREPRAGSRQPARQDVPARRRGRERRRPELVAIGLRNPWRYSFDRKTGDLWIGDVGQGEIEEVDRLPRGTYGARQLRLGRLRGRAAASRRSRSARAGSSSRSRSTRTHSGCSITGGYVYRGKKVPRLAGRYVFGDYCSGTIWSIPARGGAMRVEPVRVEGLTSFGEDLAGELYAVVGRRHDLPVRTAEPSVRHARTALRRRADAFRDLPRRRRGSERQESTAWILLANELARAPTDLRRLAERGVRDRVQRVVQAREARG